MTRGVARVNDRTIGTCSHPIHDPPISVGGTIISGSADVCTNGRGNARVNDTVLADCGHTSKIITGSPDVSTNGRPQARLNDQVAAGPYVGTIISASPDTDAN